MAKKNNPKSQFVIGSAEKLPFKKEEFDVVFVDSVFHHLFDYGIAIKEIKRVLKKRGILCFIEPHRSFLRSLLDFVCVLQVSKFIPFIKERRLAYLGEIKFMTHWLATEDEFLHVLEKRKFKEIFKMKEFLSIIGEYKKEG